MRRRRLRVQPQHVLEVLDRLGVITLCQRRSPGAELRRHRIGIELNGSGEGGLRGVGFARRETHVAEPHERIHVVGLELKHAFEERASLRQVALRARELCEVVRPPVVGRIQRLRVD